MTDPAPLPRIPAMTAGVGLILMAGAAPLGLLPVERLRGLPAADLATQVSDGLPGFGIAVLAWMAVVVLDIIVACALFLVTRAGAEAPARLAAWFRLAYAAMLGAAVMHLAEAGALGRLGDAAQAPAVRAALDRFGEGFQLALLVFSLHLLVLAGALKMSGRAAGWLAALVALAGLGYLADAVSHQLGGTLAIARFTFVGEVVLALALIGMSVRAFRARG